MVKDTINSKIIDVKVQEWVLNVDGRKILNSMKMINNTKIEIVIDSKIHDTKKEICEKQNQETYDNNFIKKRRQKCYQLYKLSH